MLYSTTKSNLTGLWKRSTKKLEKQSVIGFPVTAEPFEAQINTMLGWARQRLSKVVCVANVHMLVEAKYNEGFAWVLHRADMLTPDGMPLVWLTSRLRKRKQDRVAGMDIFLSLCEKASKENISIFFLGSTPDVLWSMEQRLKREYPNLKIAGMVSPPFRPLTRDEDTALVKEINDSGAGLVLISLGCPKQEWWMHQHKGRIQSVMVGIGGVFPIFAGEKKWAPVWVQKNGLEWLYRLVQEPGRLWKRYAKTIPLFLLLAFKQLVKVKLGLEPRFGCPQVNVAFGMNGRR
ncbi:exopolysaccharide biosynthesis protein, WecB/TagA/CpsF family [Leptolyngbya sp. PCC 7375]|nr:exopolysaccharide biosynthesis protein, WecB/TagA/CpsF family [Leptolyngbya sp. PCC 7375]